MNELPPKRRQIIRLKLKAPDIRAATSSCVKRMNSSSCNGTLTVELPSKEEEGISIVLTANMSFSSVFTTSMMVLVVLHKFGYLYFLSR